MTLASSSPPSCAAAVISHASSSTTSPTCAAAGAASSSTPPAATSSSGATASATSSLSFDHDSAVAAALDSSIARVLLRIPLPQHLCVLKRGATATPHHEQMRKVVVLADNPQVDAATSSITDALSSMSVQEIVHGKTLQSFSSAASDSSIAAAAADTKPQHEALNCSLDSASSSPASPSPPVAASGTAVAAIASSSGGKRKKLSMTPSLPAAELSFLLQLVVGGQVGGLEFAPTVPRISIHAACDALALEHETLSHAPRRLFVQKPFDPLSEQCQCSLLWIGCNDGCVVWWCVVSLCLLIDAMAVYVCTVSDTSLFFYLPLLPQYIWCIGWAICISRARRLIAAPRRRARMCRTRRASIGRCAMACTITSHSCTKWISSLCYPMLFQ